MKPILMEDIAAFRTLTQLKMNPANTHVSFTMFTPDREENNYIRDIYVTDCRSEKTVRMTGTGKDGWAIWDDDDTLLLMSARADSDKPKDYEEKTVFYRLNIHGGEAVKAFEINRNVEDARKLADGKYVLKILTDRNMPEKTEDRKEEADYHIFDELPFWANGRGYVSGKRSVLFMFDEKDGSLQPLCEHSTDCGYFTVKKGRLLYIASTWQDILPQTSGLYLYDSASGDTTCLVEEGRVRIDHCQFAGDNVIFTATDMKQWGSGQIADFWIYDAGEKQCRLLYKNKEELAVGDTPITDTLRPGGTTFRGHDDKVMFIALNHYETAVYTLKDNAITKTECIKDGAIICFAGEEGDLWYLGAEPDSLNALYHNGRKVFDPNEELFRDKETAKMEYTPFVNRYGQKVDGWVLKPKDYDPNRKYPGILEIHGGPRAAYGMVLYHEMQIWAGMGYFVFCCNPHDSEGYGEEFADLRGKYGKIDFEDLMDFTDHVLKEYPALDPMRLGASGGSYGGFMCNWIEGHTDRFAAIASQRSVSNWVADFGTSEIGFSFDRNEMGADPWTDMEKMWEQSPLKYADQAKTPILFIHSLRDYNCFIDQGVQMFTAMKHFGVPSRMVIFEEENHGLSRNGKPKHRIRRLKEMTDWFDKYLK